LTASCVVYLDGTRPPSLFEPEPPPTDYDRSLLAAIGK